MLRASAAAAAATAFAARPIGLDEFAAAMRRFGVERTMRVVLSGDMSPAGRALLGLGAAFFERDVAALTVFLRTKTGAVPERVNEEVGRVTGAWRERGFHLQHHVYYPVRKHISRTVVTRRQTMMRVAREHGARVVLYMQPAEQVVAQGVRTLCASGIEDMRVRRLLCFPASVGASDLALFAEVGEWDESRIEATAATVAMPSVSPSLFDLTTRTDALRDVEVLQSLPRELYEQAGRMVEHLRLHQQAHDLLVAGVLERCVRFHPQHAYAELTLPRAVLQSRALLMGVVLRLAQWVSRRREKPDEGSYDAVRSALRYAGWFSLNSGRFVRHEERSEQTGDEQPVLTEEDSRWIVVHEPVHDDVRVALVASAHRWVKWGPFYFAATTSTLHVAGAPRQLYVGSLARALDVPQPVTEQLMALPATVRRGVPAVYYIDERGCKMYVAAPTLGASDRLPGLRHWFHGSQSALVFLNVDSTVPSLSALL